MSGVHQKGKLLDLDKLLTDFTSWQQYVSDLEIKNQELKLQTEGLDKLLQMEKSQTGKYKEELEETKGIIAQFQVTLSKRYDTEEENRKLREDIKKLSNELKDKEKSHKQQMEERDGNIMDLQASHKAEVVHLQETLMKRFNEEREEMEKAVNMKENIIAGLQKQIEQVEKDKQTEQLKLQLEYENKMQKLQKQVVKSQQVSQSSGFNQDIFRKKLQHAKLEHEKEVEDLKKTILGLEQRLGAQSAKSAPTRSGQSATLSMSLASLQAPTAVAPRATTPAAQAKRKRLYTPKNFTM